MQGMRGYALLGDETARRRNFLPEGLGMPQWVPYGIGKILIFLSPGDQ
jgi:hypothetical protein